MKYACSIALLLSLLLVACQPKTDTKDTSETNDQPTEKSQPVTTKHPYLVLITQENESGEEVFGYADPSGEIVIPVGKYSYCFTDTLRNFGIVSTKAGKIIGIDQQENELYEVYIYDNGPDYLSDGLFRIIKNGKVGYADATGNIVITPIYACTNPFAGGKAKVALECNLVKDGEYTLTKSDSWFYINTKGEKLED